jgi:hypothetical protein
MAGLRLKGADLAGVGHYCCRDRGGGGGGARQKMV